MGYHSITDEAIERLRAIAIKSEDGKEEETNSQVILRITKRLIKKAN